MGTFSVRKTRFFNQEYLPLFVIICLGAIARILTLNREVSYFDEMLSITIAKRPLTEIIPFLLRGCDAQPPLYPLILKLLLNISSNEVWLRMFSVACGIGSLYMTYALGKLIYDRFIGLFACALMAFSEYFISYSILLRMYSFWILMSICSWYCFFKLIENPSRKYCIGYAVFTTLALYAHYFGAIFLLCETLIIIADKAVYKRVFRLWCLLQCGILVLLIPQIIYMFHIFRKFSVWGAYFEDKRPGILDFARLFKEYSEFFPLSLFYCFLIFAAVFKKVVYAFTHYRIKDNLRLLPVYLFRNKRARPIFLLFLFPITLIFAFSQGKFSFFQYHYFLPFFVFYYFFIALSVYLQSASIRKLIVVLVLLIVFLNAARLIILSAKAPKLGLKEMARIIEPELQADDLFAVHNLYVFLNMFNYLERPLKVITTDEELKVHYLLRIFALKKEEAICDYSALKNNKRIWLLIEKGKEQLLPEWFSRNNRIVLSEHTDRGRISLRLYIIRD